MRVLAPRGAAAARGDGALRDPAPQPAAGHQQPEIALVQLFFGRPGGRRPLAAVVFVRGAMGCWMGYAVCKYGGGTIKLCLFVNVL